MNKKALIKLRTEEQLSNHKGGTVVNPIKRVAKKKKYRNREYQSLYEYVRINVQGPDTLINNKYLSGRNK